MNEIPPPRVTNTMARLAELAPGVRFVHRDHSTLHWDDASPATSRGFRVAREREETDL